MSSPIPPSGLRNARGEWRPPYPYRHAPLFQWPVRIRATFKWLFGYPGFLWPSNLLMLVIAALSWFLTQPELARCATFEPGWMLQIYARNLGLIWFYYGAYHLHLYTLKREGADRKYDPNWPAKGRRFLFGDQVYDNIFWTCGVGGLVWTAYEVFTMWLYANHHIPHLDWATHPVAFVLWFLLIPFWRDFHFYWTHRLIHWKPLYRHIHYLHHKNVNPNPWSGMAMHPLETILYLSVVTIHWIVPSHPFHFVFHIQHAGLGPANAHHGFEGPILNGKFPTGSYLHYLHHRYFECNYGDKYFPFDRWFGTFRDGLPEGAGADLQEEHRDDSERRTSNAEL